MADYPDHFYIENNVIMKIKSALGLSYPYKAGSVTLKTRLYTKDEMKKILKYFSEKEFHIEINYVKSEVKISGFCKSF